MLHKITEFKKMIQQLSEEEAKSFLQLALIRLQMVEKTNYSEVEFTNDLKKMVNDLQRYKSQDFEKTEHEKVIHIVFSASTSGSLNNMLKDVNKWKEERVISLSEFFCYGPIQNLADESGREQRRKWLWNHINCDEEFLFEYEENFKRKQTEIQSIREHVPIVIWIADNSNEQMGLRFVLTLLDQNRNNVTVMNTSKLYEKLFNNNRVNYQPLHTGELPPEKLNSLYSNIKELKPLTAIEKQPLMDEWEELSNNQGLLHIWKNGEIEAVDVNYYDEYIINKARKLHNNQKEVGFMKSARLIGEVIGYLNQRLGDQFIEYRLRQLIIDGIFHIEGVPKAMMYYSVKLKELKEAESM
ncbi:DUF1835 domain-containing protein [Bacillus solimangrovi]|uniref:DUF1835 domain-containing protein n=1 Tax=Bacillus solimangrovi TaxID=1305675 RepID=A0A1E5LEJ0_9BACI|nr:DUF1835 domain-containing protein [Bacillus solimangrovi]OEH92493.1 hypothetical protein BFG57_15665 [Bacillus solimangrovi]